MGRKTKAVKQAEEVEEMVDKERQRVLELLRTTDTYTVLLDPAIDSYLDTFRVYTLMYERWRDTGFRATMKFQNKNGAKNEIKHPLAQLVDTWSDKKMRALERLGMTNKALAKKVITGGTTVNTSTGEAEADPSSADPLKAHREKFKQLRDGHD